MGANDVINPAVRDRKDHPLHGMSIFIVGTERSFLICKRSLSADFSGEMNELFYDEGTMMLFGDIKHTHTALVQLLK